MTQQSKRLRPSKAKSPGAHLQAVSEAPPTPTASRHVLTRPKLKDGETRADDIAHLMVEGSAMNAFTAMDFSQLLGGPLELTACYTHLLKNAEAVKAGDLGSVEGILAGQIVALNAMFTNLSLLARANFKQPDRFDSLLRLAFKAQGQCRATAESLAYVKYPTGAVFTRQANFQVNNGVAPPIVCSADISRSPHAEILEAHGERMDAGTTRQASDGDSPMAAVGSGNRAAKRRG